VVTLGPYVFIDRRVASAPLEAYAFDEREPNALEWYFTYPSEPVRTVRPDPWATWELREHYEQSPNPAPQGAPATLEQIRIAHNVAVAAGDVGAAERWRAQLQGAIDTSVAAGFSDGTRLLGKRYVHGVDPQLELYFLADTPLANEYLFEVISNIEAPPPLSLVPPDDKIKKYGSPFVLSPRLWRKGFIYVDRVDVRRRPGREHFAGYFDTTTSSTSPAVAINGGAAATPAGWGRAPKLVGGGEQLQLMTIQ